MAKLPQGIMGPLVGTAGPITGYLRLGIPVVRSKTRPNSFKPTAARTAQQRKLQLVLPFIKSFTGTGFLKKSFPIGTEGSTGYNRALSQTMNGALVGSDPDLLLAYPLVLVSRGSLPKAAAPTVIVEADGNLRFRWEDNSTTGKAKATDMVLLVAYFPDLEQVICSTEAAYRSEGEALLQTNNLRGQKAETWMGFINEDATDASDSVYTGTVLL
ncbi:DUF6266 family protein [Flavisolibacter tropicus]|uniref:Uncharacterized protein n=1 Tax=Flavisolibacter tropicus TaxID=1492898 RepID=A0A172TW26_9BACT|nr:DUF6266 family protein [Flavisolibacter tropicus]ANE51013.1 hypothetical protein SY85_11365 [Flavisolibacter tropicus]